MAATETKERDRREPELYEPMPGIVDLPAWLWRKLGRGARVGIGVAVLVAAALAVALAPGIQESKRERELAEARERAARKAELVRRLRAEQSPRFGRSAAVPSSAADPAELLAARERAFGDLTDAVIRDARRRVRLGQLSGPIRRVECEPFPRSVDGAGAHDELSRRRGRYSCVAVTAEFEATESSVGGVLGHSYRALIDFRTGRYALCKVSGQAGPSREQLVTTPEACGGR